MVITAQLDFETHPASKQLGQFFVFDLMDENGNDVTYLVQDELFFSVEQLRQKLDLAYQMPILAVNVQKEN